jgi:subtilisin family serine protease
VKRRRAGVYELLGALTPDSDTGYGDIRRRFQSESKAHSSAEAWLGRVSPALPQAAYRRRGITIGSAVATLGETEPAKSRAAPAAFGRAILARGK